VEYMVFLVSKLVFFAIGLDAILPGFTLWYPLGKL
jgi:hypothetical protein